MCILEFKYQKCYFWHVFFKVSFWILKWSLRTSWKFWIPGKRLNIFETYLESLSIFRSKEILLQNRSLEKSKRWSFKRVKFNQLLFDHYDDPVWNKGTNFWWQTQYSEIFVSAFWTNVVPTLSVWVSFCHIVCLTL